MDELLHHCLHGLAFEGDLGCDVFRLRELISDFYSSHVSVQQNLDDSYYAFVWSTIILYPSVRVGCVPDGQGSIKVYIPPQPRSGRNKSLKTGEQADVQASIKLTPIPDSMHYPLNELVQKYGERLRIAVDPDTCFSAITGSHTRPAKLTPMIYACLQVIARERESGISVLDLGKSTGYDQKTCFYIVKQLLELNLVVKLRRGGSSQNFCVHKHFFERSPIWQQIRDEEDRAREEIVKTPLDAKHNTDAAETSATLQFDPIDTRHLTNLTILRQRLVHLLKHSVNNTHQYTNIAVRIGFRPQSRTDRRFFIVRLKELIAEGIVEKIVVSSVGTNGARVRIPCLRLPAATGKDDMSINTPADEEEEAEEEALVATGEYQDSLPRLKLTSTLPKQIIDILEKSGSSGITLNELSDQLDSFDKRTVELLLYRMEHHPPPPHLADMTIVQVLETHGRERRYRYFTLSGYVELITREGFEEPTGCYTSKDLAHTGGFLDVHKADFYETRNELLEFLKSYKTPGGTNNAAKKKTKKEKEWKNPVLPDGTRKRGRPAKDSETAEARKQKRLKGAEKAVAKPVEDEVVETSVKDKTRSAKPRQPKRKLNDNDSPDEHAAGEVRNDKSGEMSTSIRLDESISSREHINDVAKRKRGRPPKRRKAIAEGKLKLIVIGDDTELGHGKESIKETPSESAIVAEANSSTVTLQLPDVIDPALRTPSDLSRQFPASNKIPNASSYDLQRSVVCAKSDAPLAASETHASENKNENGAVSKTIVDETRITQETFRTPITHVPLIERNAVRSGESQLNYETMEGHAIAIGDSNESMQTNTEFDQIAAEETETSDVVHLTRPLEPGDMLVDSDIQNRSVDGPEESLSLHEIEGEDHVPSVANSSVPDTNDITGAINDPFKPGHQAARSKRHKKSSYRPQTARKNISHLRRENELIQLIEKAGGIVNTSGAEFLRSYMDLIENTALAGENTSAPIGVQMDKRTINSSLDNMAANGRIKLVMTTAWTVTGAARQVKVAYLPTTAGDQIQEFLRGLVKQNDVHYNFQMDVDGSLPKAEVDTNTPRGLALSWLNKDVTSLERYVHWHKDISRAQTLLGYPDEVIREALLFEGQTTSQAYGFLKGKLARARVLHQHITGIFRHQSGSEFILSMKDRIIDSTYFETDLPLSVHCTCIPAKSHLEDIMKLLRSENGELLIKDVPRRFRSALQMGKSSYHRILSLLETLRELGIATPMRRQLSDGPTIRYPTKDGSPIALEPMPSTWSAKISEDAVQYWQFNNLAPVYLLALQGAPAFLKDFSLITEEDEKTFWEVLKLSCLDRKYAQAMLPSEISSNRPCDYTKRISTVLKRHGSWRTDYVLSWYQVQYLKQFMDPSSGDTPLQDDDSGATRLKNISFTVSAPIDAVKDYFISARAAHIRELEEAHLRHEAEIQEKVKEKTKLLEQRGAEAIANRGSAWTAMVNKVHPGLLKGVAATRLRHLRQAYVTGNIIQGSQYWEQQISDAIRSAQKTREARRLFLESALKAEDNTQKLHKKGKTKEKLKGQECTSKDRVRRVRFVWTADHDELARDASVIIRARCRNHYRIDWGALEQIFPTLTRNNVRLHIKDLMEQPSAAMYLKRLEASWSELWLTHRGTAELPDDDPADPTKFDLKHHIMFLRKYIDKGAIRVGLSKESVETQIILPSDPADLLENWTITIPNERAISDVLFNNAIGEESRERYFSADAIVTQRLPVVGNTIISDSVAFAEATLKMVVATPSEWYDADGAAKMLHALGETETSMAMDNLLSQNVLSKLVRDPKRLAPGRTLKYSEADQNALGGVLPADVFQDACQLEESYSLEQNKWREWSLTSTDGDTAALLQLISDHKIDFEFNTNHAKASRLLMEGNSKKADDDEIEIAMHVRLHNISSTSKDVWLPQIDVSPDPDGIRNEQHGRTVLGATGCCSLVSDGIVDCWKCIEESEKQISNWAEHDRRIASDLLHLIDEKRMKGMQVGKLKETARLSLSKDKWMPILQRMSHLSVPLIHFVGYSSAIVVSAKFVSSWIVGLQDTSKPMTKIFPRRWINISGGRITEVWTACLQAIMGLIHVRPGISQGELYGRLSPVYDRQEVLDGLKYLAAEGALKHKLDPALQPLPPICLEASTEPEEFGTYWFVDKNWHWYQLP